MSIEAVARFRRALDTDEALRTACETTISTEAQLVEFAIDHGYDVTAEELRSAPVELGDRELADVAGGLGQLVACDGSSKEPVAPVALRPDWYATFTSTFLRR